MKKIININFQGRVVPIEETSYDILKLYIESLQSYFANEEGREEIINDIENRFAELFSDRLKKGATCITDEDVNEIITSMGRPEDFEQDELTQGPTASSSASQKAKFSTSQGAAQSFSSEEPRRLCRSENDKILGGICSGIASFLRIDPAIVRILFALITIGGFGFGFVLYVILWIVLPSRTLPTNTRKRLYRNPDNRVIAGVASGLSAYFHIEVWIPRLLFALPLIAGILTSIFRHSWFNFDPGPVFFTGGFGGTLFITYIILWIVLPEASMASEKLEMRGEKVDLESIKKTIKSDLEGFKGHASQIGSEIKERAQQFGQEVKQSARSFSAEAGPTVRTTGSRLGHAIGVLFKAFFLFIAGIVAFSLVMALIGILFSGFGAFPFKNYLLSGFWQNFLAWSSLCLFLGIPIVALLTWLIRRLIGVRSRTHYLGYAFGSLWALGLISFICLIGVLLNNFRTKASVEEELHLEQPAGGKLLVKLSDKKVNFYGSDWFGFNWDNKGPFYSLNEDSVLMNTVRINVTKSTDQNYHLKLVKFSRGNNPRMAKDLASQIQFDVHQNDSIINLGQGFAITSTQKFRNQQVLVIVEVPVGHRIVISSDIDEYHWFNINVNGNHDQWNIDFNDNWDAGYSWTTNTEYVMTGHGLDRTEAKQNDTEDEPNVEKPRNEGYRYKQKIDSLQKNRDKDSARVRSAAQLHHKPSEKIKAIMGIHQLGDTTMAVRSGGSESLCMMSIFISSFE